MNKEYIYNIDKYTIGVDENGKDEIGLTIAIIKNEEINFLGNYYGENARCIDLLIKENQGLKKQYENAVADYETTMAEKNELKKQLEDKEDYINKLQATKDKLDKWDYENTMQQKEFINFLEDNYKETQDIWYIKILQKYKSIIGVSNEKEN